MPKARRPPAEEDGASGVSSDGPAAAATPGAPGEGGSEGQFSGERGSAPRPGPGAKSPGCPPAAKRLKRHGRPKKEKPPPSSDEDEDEDEDKADRMRALVAALSTEQLNRYELFRRAALPRALVGKVMQDACGARVAQRAVIAMAGITKVFVGEVVEEALDVCEKWGEQPPLQPKHLREAVRRLRARGQMPSTKYKKTLFF